MKETELTKLLQHEASLSGHMLWRNNTGCMFDKTGRMVRYGLGNDSAKTNAYLKFPDLVGIKKTIITQDMVGKSIGVFWGIEVKRTGWKYKGTSHEIAQKNGIDLINSLGGIAEFVSESGKLCKK